MPDSAKPSVEEDGRSWSKTLKKRKGQRCCLERVFCGAT